jgi:hypothetical protein
VYKTGHEKGLANEEQRERQRRSGSRCQAGLIGLAVCQPTAHSAEPSQNCQL